MDHVSYSSLSPLQDTVLGDGDRNHDAHSPSHTVKGKSKAQAVEEDDEEEELRQLQKEMAM